MVAIKVTPLRTPRAMRKYELEYSPATAGADETAVHAGAETEIVVSELWCPQEMIKVELTDPSAKARVIQNNPKATLTPGAYYNAAARVLVSHGAAAMAEAGVVKVVLTCKLA